MRETAAIRAGRLLTEGRLVVVAIGPRHALAKCRGEGHIYSPAYTDGEWRCDCQAAMHTREARCSHVQALKRVVSIDLENP